MKSIRICPSAGLGTLKPPMRSDASQSIPPIDSVITSGCTSSGTHSSPCVLVHVVATESFPCLPIAPFLLAAPHHKPPTQPTPPANQDGLARERSALLAPGLYRLALRQCGQGVGEPHRNTNDLMEFNPKVSLELSLSLSLTHSLNLSLSHSISHSHSWATLGGRGLKRRTPRRSGAGPQAHEQQARD